jgi:hypothetical protein
MQLPYLTSKTLKALSKIIVNDSNSFSTVEQIRDHIQKCGGIHLSKYSTSENPPELISDDSHDADNAEKIHKWIKSFKLPRAVLADGRVWSALSLTVFISYTLKRWPDADKKRRYLNLGSSQRALVRNSISRLFWTAELTSKDNDYSNTKTAFLRQDIQASLLERAFCVNSDIVHKSIGHIATEYIKNKQANNIISKKTIQSFARSLNNAGGTVTLTEVAKEMIPEIFKRSLK